MLPLNRRLAALLAPLPPLLHLLPLLLLFLLPLLHDLSSFSSTAAAASNTDASFAVSFSARPTHCKASGAAHTPLFGDTSDADLCSFGRLDFPGGKHDNGAQASRFYRLVTCTYLRRRHRGGPGHEERLDGTAVVPEVNATLSSMPSPSSTVPRVATATLGAGAGGGAPLTSSLFTSRT